jgi:hypothetical protein
VSPRPIAVVATTPHHTGRITELRNEDWPPEVVGECVDATLETIRLHDDLFDEIRQM